MCGIERNESRQRALQTHRTQHPKQPSSPTQPHFFHSAASNAERKEKSEYLFFGPTLMIKLQTLQSLDNHSDPF